MAAAAGCASSASLADLAGEIAAAQAEAASAFGDGTVFVEPYVERGRHVEVQVVGTDGSVFGDRDCSLQRRHQKVVEEAPAPRPARRGPGRAPRRRPAAAAEAIDYRGAGTVEFLYDPDTERFWFLEMNTRLQVEHPVTELVHGVDLVELQLRVGRGATRSMRARPASRPATRSRSGCTPRTRPPTTSRRAALLTLFEIPRRGPGIRVDAGLRDRQRGVHALRRDAGQGRRARADPRAGRPQAGRRPGAAPGSTACVTNRDLLVAVLRDDGFLAGEVSHRLPRLTALVDPPGRRRAGGRARRRPLATAAEQGVPVGGATRPAAASRSPGATWCRQPQVHRVRRTTRSSSSGGAAATATPSTALQSSPRARPR